MIACQYAATCQPWIQSAVAPLARKRAPSGSRRWHAAKLVGVETFGPREKPIWISRQYAGIPSEGPAEFGVSARARAMIRQIPNFKRHSPVAGERLPKRDLIMNQVRCEDGQHQDTCISNFAERLR